MSAKAKSDNTNKDDGAQSYMAANKDPELEKKIDALMSIEEPKNADASPDQPVESEEVTPPAVPAVGGVTGAPLLPSDKLPDLSEPSVKKTKASTRKTKAPEPVVDPDPEPAEAVEQPEETQAAKPGVHQSEVTQPTKDELGLEDASTSRAVDEIMAADADELLEVHDRSVAVAAPAKHIDTKRSNLLVRMLRGWWRNKLARNSTILLLLIGIGAVAAFPTSRYYILNAAGVRASSSVTILDATTGQPLKNAEFRLQDQIAKTSSEGTANLRELRLGPAELEIKKPAFADIKQSVTIGWGSNPLGDFRLKAVGTQYTFTITDFVSKLPIAKAEVSSGQADARSNEKGELILTIPRSVNDEDTVTIQVGAENYRTETVSLPRASREAQSLQLVPARKHIFVSKRSGKFDVYKTDVDGKNEEKILTGTGTERADMLALSVHQSKDIAALVSVRGNAKSSNGLVLSTLTLINTQNNTSKQVTQSERIQLVEWIDNKLIYVKVAEGTNISSTDRHRLVSYDIETGTEHELASTNYFNDVIAVNGSIYYSPALYQANGPVGLFKINADGNYKKTIFDKEVWNLFRTGYDKMSVSMGQDWYELNLNDDSLSQASAPPSAQKSRVYQDGPSGNISLWTDERDGKGVLLGFDKQTKIDKAFQTQSGLKNPVRWLDAEHVIYRVSSNQETADYIISINGGSPQKIRDVTDTAGVDRWYYY